eukprot:gene15870-24248_t
MDAAMSSDPRIQAGIQVLVSMFEAMHQGSFVAWAVENLDDNFTYAVCPSYDDEAMMSCCYGKAAIVLAYNNTLHKVWGGPTSVVSWVPVELVVSAVDPNKVSTEMIEIVRREDGHTTQCTRIFSAKFSPTLKVMELLISPLSKEKEMQEDIILARDCIPTAHEVQAWLATLKGDAEGLSLPDDISAALAGATPVLPSKQGASSQPPPVLPSKEATCPAPQQAAAQARAGPAQEPPPSPPKPAPRARKGGGAVQEAVVDIHDSDVEMPPLCTGSYGNSDSSEAGDKPQSSFTSLPAPTTDRPCEHNNWDSVRVKRKWCLLRCRECFGQWRIRASDVD